MPGLFSFLRCLSVPAKTYRAFFWTKIMIDKNCTQCHFAIASQIVDEKGTPVVGKYQYNCNRLPPSCFMVPTVNGPQMASAFPVVNDSQICSLFIDDETGAELSPVALNGPNTSN